ncbi:MAG: SDR family oxidoreductase [Saprospiraceae bacterium]|nr:SDR family oxidoreductase [Saprospiraceae bacterium]
MKNILIVGGSSGIGYQLVQSLDKNDHQVFATYHSNKMVSDETNLQYHPLDVTGDSVSFNYLPDTLHGLVYCPGTINLKPFSRITPDDFLKDYNIQVIGAIKVIQEVLPQLKKSGAGSIVLFSTVAVQRGFNFHTQVAASKGAIEGLCRALSAEFAPGIRVNCVAPSLTDTGLAARLIATGEKRKLNADRHPLKRIGTPKDMAEMTAYLLSEKASWITGQIFKVDGGISSIN